MRTWHGAPFRPVRPVVFMSWIMLAAMTVVSTNPDGNPVRAGDDAVDQPGGPIPVQEQYSTFTISGRATELPKHALSQVTVGLYRVERGQAPVPFAETRSDENGCFQFSKVPSLCDQGSGNGAYYAIAATAPLAASCYERVIESQQVEIDLAMPHGVTVNGRILDPTGKVLKGALVWYDRFPDGSLREAPIASIMSAITNEEGEFTIRDLPPLEDHKKPPIDQQIRMRRRKDPGIVDQHEYRLTVHHPDFADQLVSLRKAPAVVVIDLAYGGHLRGKVVDDVSGKPAAGITVTIQPTKQTSIGLIDCRHLQTSQTNAQGEYQFRNVPAVQYNIWATADDRTCAALNSVPVLAKETCAAPDLKLVEGGWIEGQIVTLQGHPVSHGSETGDRLKVGLSGPARPRTGVSFESCDVDDDGHFRIRVLKGRNFPYLVSNTAWRRVWRSEKFERGLDVASGETVKVKFRMMDKPSKPSPPVRPERNPVRLPSPVADEWDAAETIRDLGGWYTLDNERHVVEINMVYDDRTGVRYDNGYTASDEALRIAPTFTRLKRLYLHQGQATDESMASLAELEGLESFYVWNALALTDAGTVHLAHLKNLVHIHLGEGGIGDGTLEVVGKLKKLTMIGMQGNHFTDAGLAHLANSNQLTSLWLGMSKGSITDAGVEHLSGLDQLQTLDLQGNQITDAGLEHIKPLVNLQTLHLGKSITTADGLADLRKALPNLRINN